MDDSRRHYRENDILTASQKKLIIVLYDACLRRLDQAAGHFPAANGRAIAQIHSHLCAAQDILTELMATLDFQNGGTVAANLYQIYRYFHQQIGQANLRKQVELLQGVREQLGNLRDAWAEIKEPTVPERKAPGGGLDLTG